MSPRGGAQPGSGRPVRWEQGKTKVSVDKETHKILKGYAESANMPVIDLIHDLVRHKDFTKLVNDIARPPKTNETDEE